MKRYRAKEHKCGYWHIEESTVFGGWRPIDVVHGEEAAREELRRLTERRVIYPEHSSASVPTEKT